MYPLAGYYLYREVFDRSPEKSELLSLIRDLDSSRTSVLLCQINADLRLAKRDREAVGKLEQDLAGYLLEDETVRRFKERFGLVHMADKLVFHPLQILNMLKLVIEHSAGDRDPVSDEQARYALGSALLMMNDLFLTEEEQVDLASEASDDKARALMTQMLGPFEVVNSAAITHVIYRARVMFHDLLKTRGVLDRIARECQGFNFDVEFSKIVGMPLSNWIFLLVGFYTYLAHYLLPDGNRSLEFLAIDRKKFGSKSRIPQKDIEAVLATISTTPEEFRRMLGEKRPTDWRFDFVPFKSKPFIEFQPDKFFCGDIGFLVEKMNSGLYWTINDGLPSALRQKLFKAWGILFEEYVNWFLVNRNFKQGLFFWPSPKWTDGTESFDGAFMQDSRFMPMEFKGRYLKVEARYSGNFTAFEADLELKIGEGCRQLARKIELLFNMDFRSRKRLAEIPLEHVTRVVPVLVVQDNILRGPFVNWWLNKRFNQLLDRSRLRCGVTVDSMNVVGIHELETMAESAEAGSFDVFHGLQLRCYSDPEMRSDLQNFLLTVPGYGAGKSARIDEILDQQWDEIEKYMFPDEDRAANVAVPDA